VCVVPFVIFACLENNGLAGAAFALKFCLKLRTNTTETFEMLKVALGEQRMGRT
jgi:hypothetical protein